MIVTTEAIVLKAMKYRDTSKIVTLYTKGFGKISVIAKGARGKKNKFGSALEPMSYIQSVFYRKELRDLQLLSQADLIETWNELRTRELKLITGLCVIEFLHACLHDEETHEDLFFLARDALRRLNSIEKNEVNILLWFLLWMIPAFGFGFSSDRCAGCGKDLAHRSVQHARFKIEPDRGRLFCPNCSSSHSGIEMTLESVRAMKWFASSKIDTVHMLSLSTRASLQLIHPLHAYLRHHIEGMKKIRSLTILETILLPHSTRPEGMKIALP